VLFEFYYPGQEKKSDKLPCMVLKKEYDANEIQELRICTVGKELKKLGFKKKESESPRHSLLVAKQIETAFNEKKVCFLFDSEKQKLRFKVLDPSLLETTVEPSTKTFSKINEKSLHLEKGVSPFRSQLNWQAKQAFALAKENKWITDEDEYKPYDSEDDGTNGSRKRKAEDGVDGENPSKKQKYECTICSREFTDLNSITQHNKVRHPPPKKPYRNNKSSKKNKKKKKKEMKKAKKEAK